MGSTQSTWGLISRVSSRTYRERQQYVCLGTTIRPWASKEDAHQTMRSNPKVNDAPRCHCRFPLPLGSNFYLCWAGLVLYVAVPFNAVACIHRFNHFKKYGGGFTSRYTW